MEFSSAASLGIIKGASIGKLSIRVTHNQYADDTLIRDKWEGLNIINITRILHCFYQVSGLKRNLGKSSQIGVHVPEAQVKDMAELIGCKARLKGAIPLSWIIHP